MSPDDHIIYVYYARSQDPNHKALMIYQHLAIT